MDIKIIYLFDSPLRKFHLNDAIRTITEIAESITTLATRDDINSTARWAIHLFVSLFPVPLGWDFDFRHL